MSFKNKRSCSKFEHHEGAPPIAKSDEKPPLGMENGDIVLTNVVSATSLSVFGFIQCDLWRMENLRRSTVATSVIYNLLQGWVQG